MTLKPKNQNIENTSLFDKLNGKHRYKSTDWVFESPDGGHYSEYYWGLQTCENPPSV